MPALRESLAVTLEHSKDTKGTHVFRQVEPDEPIIPSLYVKKGAIPEGTHTIEVSVHPITE